MKKYSFLFLFCSFLSFSFAQDAIGVIDKMITAVSAGKSYEYTMKQTERIDGKLYNNTIFTKVVEQPKKIFINNIAGENKGVQLIYVKGQNNNKAVVNKMFNIKLSPFNSLIRKNQHHTILESGFKLLLSSIKGAKARAQSQNALNEVFTYAGKITYNGTACHKIVINDPTFTYNNYTIKANESLYSIAMKNNVCEQLIVEKNGLSGFGSGKEGQTIQIPSSYAKKTILYIDASTYFPVYQEMHDDKGMFEKYEFSGLKINPSFSDIDFSTDNESYDF